MVNQAKLSGPLSPVREHWMPTEQAIEQYLAYEEQYGRGYALLACHAAFPLVVTSELVNLIRLNFLAGQAIDWLAETDFLLAFCRPIDANLGLYQIDPGLRCVMLADLQESEYGLNRLYELADFLLAYSERYAGRLRRPDIARVHQWIALSYLYPQKVIEDMKSLLLAQKENRPAINNITPAYQIHIANMIEVMRNTFEESILTDETHYQELIKEAHVIAHYWYETEVTPEAKLGSDTLHSAMSTRPTSNHDLSAKVSAENDQQELSTINVQENEDNTIDASVNSHSLASIHSSFDTQQIIMSCRTERMNLRNQDSTESGACVELFRRAFTNDIIAWEGVNDIFKPELMMWARSWDKVLSIVDPEDLAQEAMLNFFRYAPQRPHLLASTSLSPIVRYLYLCLKSAALQQERSTNEQPPLLDLDAQFNAVDPTDYLGSSIVNKTLQPFIEHWARTEDERIIFTLYFVQDYKPREIWDMYQERFGTYENVANTLQRLIRRMRKDAAEVRSALDDGGGSTLIKGIRQIVETASEQSLPLLQPNWLQFGAHKLVVMIRIDRNSQQTDIWDVHVQLEDQLNNQCIDLVEEATLHSLSSSSIIYTATLAGEDQELVFKGVWAGGYSLHIVLADQEIQISKLLIDDSLSVNEQSSGSMSELSH